MNPNKLSRLTITILMAIVGALFGWYAVGDVIRLVSTQGNLNPQNMILSLIYHVLLVVSGGVFGFALGARLFQRIENLGERLRVMSASDKVPLLVGPSIGLAVSALVALPIINNPLLSKMPAVATAIAVLIWIILTYFLTVALSSMKTEIGSWLKQPAPEEPAVPKEKFKILDTNVIIDGRIADIARAGFVEGPIYIPGFVLEELQHIADSHDSLKRARGRRGLDTLNQMDKELNLTVRTYDKLASATGEVDGRLVQLAKALDGALVTNDWNLNKVAELQGVPVLNINELANALKPVVLPGEEMHVLIVKEGKDPSQGIGYLDDGTMIVVEGGSRHMGENADVLVSSVLQTSAGKMIFAHMRDEEEYASERGVRAYTGGRARRPVRRSGE